MTDYQRIIDKYYESGSALRQILTRHSMQVAALAQEIARERHLDLDPADVEAAAMLHDIGIYLTDAPAIECRGTEPYIRHGVLGARLLRAEGCPEWLARVAERHTGAGLTRADIAEQRLPLEPGDYVPETTLERLVCYADKFYSKSGDMRRKPYAKVRAQMERHGADTLRRFEELHAEFGLGEG